MTAYGSYVLDTLELSTEIPDTWLYAVGSVIKTRFQFNEELDRSTLADRLHTVLFSSQVSQAIEFATRIHSNQERKIKGVPFVTHVLSVALIVAILGGSEDQIVAAVLHDTVEDCKPFGKVTVDKLNEQFGTEVSKIVQDLTELDPHRADPNIPREPFVLRKARVVESISSFSDDSLIVKAADLQHNSSERLADSRQYGQHIWERFNGGRAETIVHFRALFTAIKDQCDQREIQLPLSADLERVISELEQDFAKDWAASVASANKSDV